MLYRTSSVPSLIYDYETVTLFGKTQDMAFDTLKFAIACISECGSLICFMERDCMDRMNIFELFRYKTMDKNIQDTGMASFLIASNFLGVNITKEQMSHSTTNIQMDEIALLNFAKQFYLKEDFFIIVKSNRDMLNEKLKKVLHFYENSVIYVIEQK